jgi:hypothetical protein
MRVGLVAEGVMGSNYLKSLMILTTSYPVVS